MEANFTPYRHSRTSRVTNYLNSKINERMGDESSRVAEASRKNRDPVKSSYYHYQAAVYYDAAEQCGKRNLAIRQHHYDESMIEKTTASCCSIS